MSIKICYDKDGKEVSDSDMNVVTHYINMGDNGSQSHYIRSIGCDLWDAKSSLKIPRSSGFLKVNEEQFKFYCRYIETSNKAYLRQADRG